jgi:hypothetical protein
VECIQIMFNKKIHTQRHMETFFLLLFLVANTEGNGKEIQRKS